LGDDISRFLAVLLITVAASLACGQVITEVDIDATVEAKLLVAVAATASAIPVEDPGEAVQLPIVVPETPTSLPGEPTPVIAPLTPTPVPTPSPLPKVGPTKTPSPPTPTTATIDTFGDGEYFVGVSIGAIIPGLYTSDGGPTCFWARLGAVSDEPVVVVESGESDGLQRVTILVTDMGFVTDGCGEWTRESGDPLPTQTPRPSPTATSIPASASVVVSFDEFDTDPFRLTSSQYPVEHGLSWESAQLATDMQTTTPGLAHGLVAEYRQSFLRLAPSLITEVVVQIYETVEGAEAAISNWDDESRLMVAGRGGHVLAITSTPGMPITTGDEAISVLADYQLDGTNIRAILEAYAFRDNNLVVSVTGLRNEATKFEHLNLLVSMAQELASKSADYLERLTGLAATPVPTPTRVSVVTFGDGIHQVGVTIPFGNYTTTGSPSGCYWARLSGFSGTLDDIIANQFASGPQVVTIFSSDRGFESSGCGTWVKQNEFARSTPTPSPTPNPDLFEPKFAIGQLHISSLDGDVWNRTGDVWKWEGKGDGEAQGISLGAEVNQDRYRLTWDLATIEFGLTLKLFGLEDDQPDSYRLLNTDASVEFIVGTTLRVFRFEIDLRSDVGWTVYLERVCTDC
jgi:hypothetical protein